jgi:hypothetical protein
MVLEKPDCHYFLEKRPQHNSSNVANSPKSIKATVGSSSDNQPIFNVVHENKGSDSVPDYSSDHYQDEYSTYDEMWDANADELLINSGATIIRSEIQLTDSSGRNRVLVRRQDNDSQWNI